MELVNLNKQFILINPEIDCIPKAEQKDYFIKVMDIQHVKEVFVKAIMSVPTDLIFLGNFKNKNLVYSSQLDKIRSFYSLPEIQFYLEKTNSTSVIEQLESNLTIEKVEKIIEEISEKPQNKIRRDSFIINFLLEQFKQHTEYTLNHLKLLNITSKRDNQEALTLTKIWRTSYNSYISFAMYLALLEQTYSHDQINSELDHYQIPKKQSFTQTETKIDKSSKIYKYLEKTWAKYSTELIKFPRTEHIFDAKKYFGTDSSSVTRDDLLITEAELKSLFNKPLSIEEKIDGANLGVLVDYSGKILVQNRSHYVCDGISSQFEGLDIWVANNEEDIRKLLQGKPLIMYGEWCYLKHSIHYTGIPDYFICFDIYNKIEDKFYSRKRVTEMLEETKINQVPIIDCDKIITKKEEFVEYLKKKSQFSDVNIEGIYVRLFDPTNEYLIKRCKLVRPDFLPEKEETVHWSKKMPTKNILNFADC